MHHPDFVVKFLFVPGLQQVGIHTVLLRLHNVLPELYALIEVLFLYYRLRWELPLFVQTLEQIIRVPLVWLPVRTLNHPL